MQVSRPRGTQDVLPGKSGIWQHIEAQARQVAGLFSYEEIRTPLFEAAELFARGIGSGTDLVDKEMYAFTDRGGRQLVLRPEGTAPVVRAYLENHLDQGGTPSRLFYLQPNFRYERPQAGRYRQHMQFGVELFGAASPAADAEVITLAHALMERLRLGPLRLLLNSIGCPVCRPAFREKLREYYAPLLRQLCADCQTRFELNPLRLLDCKEETDAELKQGAPRSVDHLCAECRAHHEGLMVLLDQLLVEYELDPTLVRGLDYYTRTVFEFVPCVGTRLLTIGGGGRYDLLIEALGGEPTPAVGFGIGLERLIELWQQQHDVQTIQHAPVFYFVVLEAEAMGAALALANRLRAKDIAVECQLSTKSAKAQFKQADRSGARFVAVFAPREWAAQQIRIQGLRAQGVDEVVELAAPLERIIDLTKEAAQ